MSAEGAPSRAGAWRGNRWLIILPLVVFAGLAALMFVRLQWGDPSRVPSALIGREVPEFALPALEGAHVPGFATEDLRGHVSVVNVWASWCGPCIAEHPFLVTLAEDESIRLMGINYKDEAENARRFLGRLGNPYAAVGVDISGRTAIDWGVYGVPETFVVDAEGRIVHKHVGPIDAADLDMTIRPAIERARAGS